METPQGLGATAEPNSPSGQPQPQPNAGVPQDVTPYLPEPTATPTAPQGVTQGQPQTAGTPDSVHFQRIADQRQAEIFRLQQELERTKQTQVAPANANVNPHDPNTNWSEWLKFENRSALREATQAMQQQNQQWFMGMAQNAYESEWQKSHPNVSIQDVKAFGQANGISNIDHAFTIMTLPQYTAQVAQATQQSTLSQFSQPQVAANPVRPQGGASQGPVQLSYEAMATAYQQSNGAVYNQWSPELRRAFDRETNMRYEAKRG